MITVFEPLSIQTSQVDTYRSRMRFFLLPIFKKILTMIVNKQTICYNIFISVSKLDTMSNNTNLVKLNTLDIFIPLYI
jgi:hypothetical protein